MQNNKPRPLDYILVSLAVLFWGFSLIWTDQILDQNVPVFVFTFMRMAIAGVLMLAVTIPTKKLQKIQKGDLKYFILLVFFEPFLYFIGESYGLKATGSPTLVAVVIAAIPIFTTIVGQVFYNEPLTKFNIAGVGVTTAGVIAFIISGGSMHAENYWSGLAILLLAVAGSLGYCIMCRTLSHRYTAVTIVTYQFSMAIPFFLVPFIFLGLPQWRPEFLSASVLVPLVMLAVFCSCICFGFYTHSIAKIGVTKSVIFTSLIPVVSAITAYFVGQDSLTTLQIIGMVVAIVGVIMAQYKK